MICNRFFPAKTFFLVLTILIGMEASAQKRKPYHLPYYDNAPYHFGFLLGYNRMNFTVDHATGFETIVYTPPFSSELPAAATSAMVRSIYASPSHGFNIGIVSDLHLGELFNLRFTPTLSFGQRSLNFRVETKPSGEVPVELPDIFITFVDFPLYLKYKSVRLNNMRNYLIGGVKYSIDLTSKNKRVDFLKLYRNDVYLDLGTGFDFYTEYFKFGVELKMSYGLRNLINREGAAADDFLFINSIDALRSKIFMLTFTFE